jgi:hypothetical protein
MLIIWHHIIHAPEDDPERINAFHINTERTLYSTWNSSAWSRRSLAVLIGCLRANHVPSSIIVTFIEIM